MRTSTFMAAMLGAAYIADPALAKKAAKPTVLDMEAIIERSESRTAECKGKFLDVLTTFHPMDQPGKALEDMAIHVCLDYAGFIPCKYYRAKSKINDNKA